VSRRPKVRCPCCEDFFEATELSGHQLGKNRYGIGVFSCPGCTARIKLDPYEYIAASHMMASGHTPDGVAIEAYREKELIPVEKKARKEMGWFARLFGG
jgi:hypothetical protein